MKNDESLVVLNPRGTAPTITLLPMAPRLDTLTGKTIYIVNMNFPYTDPFFEELQKILTSRYPQVSWVFRVKAGSYFDDDPKLWAEIEEKGDGAVMAVGQLDTVIPMVIIFCSKLEKLGIPTAPVITRAFPELAKTFAYKKGMPNLRFTFLPHPYANRPASLYRNYLEGNDPITGRPVMEEIVEALVRPLVDEEKQTGMIERPESRLLHADTQANLERLFYESGWTDGLPIVLPTEERVAEMLKGTSRRPDEPVGEMQTSPPHELWKYTVEQVAVNAVMAGAGPEHFPVILAIASTGITSLFSSATSWARMVVVNGPIREEIKMNAGIGALGPFNRANAVIGRAWTLISKNLGGAIAGLTYLGDIGNNYNYNNICFAENEEALPGGWRPFHVQKGFQAGESTVSILKGWSLIDYAAYKPHPHHEIMSRQLLSFETSGVGTHHTLNKIKPVAQGTFLISPITAQDLRDQGFENAERVGQWLKENTFTSMWNYWTANPADLRSAKEGVEPFASLLKLSPDAKSPYRLVQPDLSVEIIVVGGGTDAFWMAGDFGYLASASVDDWR
jgi:hypothetical protein